MKVRGKASAVEDEALVERVLSVLDVARIPVSIDYVAHNANLTWGTARAVLFHLALLGRIKGTKTTKSWIFQLPEAVRK